jgi:antitoxin HicB
MTTIAGYPCAVRHLTADEGGGYLISFPDLPGCMSDGNTMAEAKKNAADAVASYLASCRKHNDPIPEPGSGGPASGKFLARLPKSMHAALIERSRHEGVSMNQFLTALVAEGLGRPAPMAGRRHGRRASSATRRRAPQHA